MKEIVLVFGRLCSGKGTFCKPYIDDGYHHITTSDIVRRLSGESTRDKLQGTHDLDLAIGDEMVEVISDYDRIIIDGIRQVRIVEKILRAYTDVKLVWLEVPISIRQERFLSRGAAKDNQTFEIAEQGDTKLGLDEVEATYKDQCEIVHHYCTECQDDRYIYLMCCSGHMCGCYGHPVGFRPCRTCNPDGTAKMSSNFASYEYLEHLEYFHD